MPTEYTLNRPHPLLVSLQAHLTKPQWHNLIALIVAVQFSRTLIGRRLALFLAYAITSASCYRRLERMLAWKPEVWRPLLRAWVGAAIRVFAPGRGPIPLLIDWTSHRERCRSLWVMLPVGGRAVPLAFWLSEGTFGGKGGQRAFEDAAVKALKSWLPKSRKPVLIGDRGFRGIERLRGWTALGFSFVVRLTSDTMIETPQGWKRLREVELPFRAKTRLSKKRPIRMHVRGVRQALVKPKPVRDWKGHLTETTTETTTWYLASDLPLEQDLVEIYAWRMQIEETFRDFKDFFGLETERRQQPGQRLFAFLFALMVGEALDLHAAGVHAPAQLPTAASEEPPVSRETSEARRYPAESRTREGLHEVWVQALQGTLAFQEDLQAIWQKNERMKARPQVQERRRSDPAGRNRQRSNSDASAPSLWNSHV